jgi:hypothetical protein
MADKTTSVGQVRGGGTAESPTTLDNAKTTLKRWLYLESDDPLELALAAVIANKMPGDPVRLLVGPPGSGKTEIVMSLDADPSVWIVSTLTQAVLLSGVSARERGRNAAGGLLCEMRSFGILAPKDLGSVMSTERNRTCGPAGTGPLAPCRLGGHRCPCRFRQQKRPRRSRDPASELAARWDEQQENPAPRSAHLRLREQSCYFPCLRMVSS